MSLQCLSMNDIDWNGLESKRIEYILEGNLLEKSVKRPFCCTISILQSSKLKTGYRYENQF